MVRSQLSATATTARRGRGRPAGTRNRGALRKWETTKYREVEGWEYDPQKTPEQNERDRWVRDANGRKIVVMRHHTRTIQRRKVLHYQRRAEPVVPRARVVTFVRGVLADLQREFEPSRGGKGERKKLSLAKDVTFLLNDIVDQHGNDVLNLARRLHEHGHPDQYRLPEKSVAFAAHTLDPSWWGPLTDDGVDDQPPLPAGALRRHLNAMRAEEPPEPEEEEEEEEEEESTT